MRAITFSVGPLASAAANNVCLSQTPLAAGALTLNGSLASAGVVTMDTPRQALFTFAADETGHSFVVVGTSWANDPITETVAGTTAGTVATVLSYKTISSITISAAATGAMTVGTNGVASSPWVRCDGWADPNIAIQCNVTGTVNYTVQTTTDDPNSPTNPIAVASITWVNSPDLNFVAQTATAQGYLSFVPMWMRVVLNSGTGSVATTMHQSGSVTY